MSYVRLIVRGTYDGVQGFSFGMDFKVLGVGPVAPADLSAWVTATGTPFATWFNAATGGLKLLISPQGSISRRDAYFHPSDTGPAAFAASDSSGGGAGTASGIHPPQTAIVCSLQTGFTGRKNRGRFYLPGIAVPTDLTSGRIATTQVTAISLDAATFITNVNSIALAANAVGCAVMPTGDIVTRVVVDNVFDTQRRRRNKIGPTFTAVTLV
jgi:hypothetical protein